MSHTRNCTRCGAGTETCYIGNFYACSVCDVEQPTEAKPRTNVKISFVDVGLRRLAMPSPPFSVHTHPTGVGPSGPTPLIQEPPTALDRLSLKRFYQKEAERVVGENDPSRLPLYKTMQSDLDTHGDGFSVRPHFAASVTRWGYPLVIATSDIPQAWRDRWADVGF